MTTPFTPPPGGFGFGPADPQAGGRISDIARCTSSGARHVAISANTCATSSASTMRAPASPAPVRASVPGAADSSSASTRAAASARAAVAAVAADAAVASRRGDVRAAILTLLAERPMHGYEMIQEIAERSQNLWRPSPGSVYPTLQLLVDEGLIAATESEGSKKLFELTDDGRAAAEKIETPPWEEITDGRRARTRQPAQRRRPTDGRRRTVRVRRNGRAAEAHHRHRQQRPPRDLPESSARSSRPTEVGVSPAGVVYANLYANLPAGLIPRRPRRIRRHATARPRCVRAAPRP